MFSVTSMLPEVGQGTAADTHQLIITKPSLYFILQRKFYVHAEAYQQPTG